LLADLPTLTISKPSEGKHLLTVTSQYLDNAGFSCPWPESNRESSRCSSASQGLIGYLLIVQSKSSHLKNAGKADQNATEWSVGGNVPGFWLPKTLLVLET